MAKDVMCKNCLILSNGWCEKKADSPAPDMVRDCRHFQQKTNGDRIRAMSDEELTDAWIRDNTICNRCAYQDECECDEFVTNEKCKEGVLAWHKQPVEEGADG